jgi:hypothetical protein
MIIDAHCIFFFVDPGQPGSTHLTHDLIIRPGRQSDRVSKLCKKPIHRRLRNPKKNRPLQSLQSSAQSMSIQPRPLPPPWNPRPIMLNKQLSWSLEVTIDLFEIVVVVMVKSVFHLKIHQNNFLIF